MFHLLVQKVSCEGDGGFQYSSCSASTILEVTSLGGGKRLLLYRSSISLLESWTVFITSDEILGLNWIKISSSELQPFSLHSCSIETVWVPPRAHSIFTPSNERTGGYLFRHKMHGPVNGFPNARSFTILARCSIVLIPVFSRRCARAQRPSFG